MILPSAMIDRVRQREKYADSRLSAQAPKVDSAIMVGKSRMERKERGRGD